MTHYPNSVFGRSDQALGRYGRDRQTVAAVENRDAADAKNTYTSESVHRQSRADRRELIACIAPLTEYLLQTEDAIAANTRNRKLLEEARDEMRIDANRGHMEQPIAEQDAVLNKLQSRRDEILGKLLTIITVLGGRNTALVPAPPQHRNAPPPPLTQPSSSTLINNLIDAGPVPPPLIRSPFSGGSNADPSTFSNH